MQSLQDAKGLPGGGTWEGPTPHSPMTALSSRPSYHVPPPRTTTGPGQAWQGCVLESRWRSRLLGTARVGHGGRAHWSGQLSSPLPSVWGHKRLCPIPALLRELPSCLLMGLPRAGPRTAALYMREELACHAAQGPRWVWIRHCFQRGVLSGSQEGRPPAGGETAPCRQF